MISLDTNILFPLVVQDHAQHEKVRAFVESAGRRDDVVISELVLLELYNLLRNPTVMTRPLSATAAVDVCEGFRRHPHWQLVGFPPDSRLFHDRFWPRLRTRDFARRRSFDWRLALSLMSQGVTDFATVNVADFKGFGFTRVWNPMDSSVPGWGGD
jgi:toxin-antitoxin system PIN domain toxin